MKTVKKFPVLLIVSVVLCALGYVLRPLMPGWPTCSGIWASSGSATACSPFS